MSNLLIRDVMVRTCNDYYMIDAMAGGEVIRKRKYRRENTMIGYKWYDYNGVEVIDPIEISRLDGLATKHQRVDEAYDDHAIFMSSTNYVNSVSGIPMDKHMVVVEWRSDSEQGFVTMAHDEGLDGDSYYIVVINAGDKQATIYTPIDPEGPKDGTSRADDGDNISVGGSYVSISPKQVERIRVTFRDGKWYYELVTKTYPSNTGGIKIGDVDYVTFRYLWESSSGRDLDTMTEALNSNVPTIDNLAVGWSGPGNGDSSVREVLKWGGDNTGPGKECVLSMYLDANPVDKRPSGVLQAPSGFIKGQSNGSPSTPMEMVYVLMNNYGWRFSMAPEASVLRSIRSSDIDTRSYKPYKLIVFDDGRTFVGNGDVLAHDTDKVLSFGGQPEGEYLCDSMGLDRNVIVEYFNKIGNG